mmetsp:Transcript_749/g.735  ORF Transcript_749/g.735 Transcript_749/m.735 type:complete len:132 (+) Transcript_749:71-466(+)
MHFMNTRATPPASYPPPPESRPVPFRRDGSADKDASGRTCSFGDTTVSHATEETFQTAVGSSWTPSNTAFLSIASPVGSSDRSRVDSTTAQRVRIDSLVGGNPVDNNANVYDEMMQQLNTTKQRSNTFTVI